jgi:hypothetical protein
MTLLCQLVSWCVKLALLASWAAALVRHLNQIHQLNPCAPPGVERESDVYHCGYLGSSLQFTICLHQAFAPLAASSLPASGICRLIFLFAVLTVEFYIECNIAHSRFFPCTAWPSLFLSDFFLMFSCACVYTLPSSGHISVQAVCSAFQVLASSTSLSGSQRASVIAAPCKQALGTRQVHGESRLPVRY